MSRLVPGKEYTRVQCTYNLRNLERVYTDEGSALTFVAGGRTASRANIPAECDFKVFDDLHALEEPAFELEKEQAL
jgi:hypothetical protein